MSPPTDLGYLQGLVTELRKLPAETGWVEFKENNSNPDDIGEYLSALSNTAALEGKAQADLLPAPAFEVPDGSTRAVLFA